ncbi:hypothetical protein M0R45_015905 [Rubus argutus]|uniref:Bacterial surface antigen (D15) domain-containing protein n=1 Tax=Rubus argutus TaxID=59490 RepID=A0AAW1XRX7_RUBAR
MDLNEPASSKWSSTTSIKFEHVRPVNDNGRPMSRDLDGFPVTCSGSPHDSMVVLKQESRYAKANDRSFFHFSLQIEQGIPVLSKWLIFNKFKFVASKGVKLGPAFLLTRMTGGSIVGDMAPYQAFGNWRELTLPLYNKMLEGAVFLDCGTDLGSAHHVPGNPALRLGKPGSGVGLGYGLRLKSQFGHFVVDTLLMPFQQKTVYFGISNLAS